VLTGVPLFQLRDDESAMLAGSLADVMEYYGVALTGPTSVWIGLLGAVGMVYGPRYFMLQQMRAAARARPASMAATPDQAPPRGGNRPYSFDMDAAAA